MLQTRTRPFTNAERERLQAELLEATNKPTRPDYSGAFGIGALYALFGLLLSLPVIGLVSIFQLPAFYLVTIAAFGALTGFFFGFRTEWRNNAWHEQYYKKHAATLATRLQKGQLEETTVTASAVAEVTDADCDSTGYFFDIGDNRVLFLVREAFYNEEEDPDVQQDDVISLPSAFTFTQYHKETGNIATVKPTGAPLKVSRRLTLEYGDWHDTYHSGAVFENATLTTLETDLPYLTAAAPEV